MSSCVSRVMAGRKKMFKGGEVTNGEEDDYEKLADDRPADFDALHLERDIDGYDAENSGDELGNEKLSHDRSEAVARIMRQRQAGRNPRPA